VKRPGWRTSKLSQMNMPRAIRGAARVACHRVAAITVVLLAMLAARPAYADNVDQLINQLDDDSEKVRLSATLNLTKLGDARAIPALAKRLTDDSSADVRKVAVVGLRTLVTDKIKGSARTAALDALKRAADGDSNANVQRQAKIAYDVISAAGGGIAPTQMGGSGSIYVNVGPMSSKTGTANDAKLRTVMNTTAGKTLNKVASSMATTWAGGGVPTKSQLAQKNTQGFYVDGTLNELKIDKAGNSSKVSCKISMLLASFPDKSVFGFLNGNAAVTASASDRDIALAGEDCVTAVVEDLIAKKIVPTIKAKVTP
jgi:HEAT repeat protein